MIDTIVLMISSPDFVLMDYDRFSPNARGFFEPPYLAMGRSGMVRAICNPTKADKDAFGYLPRLTLVKAVRPGGFQTFLNIEFSAPKVVFGNNFDELIDADFEKLCKRLLEILTHYKVRLWNGLETLKKAKVNTVHYSKNLIFTNGITPITITETYDKCDVSQWLDVEKTGFQNSGHSYRSHGNTREFVIYDKLHELDQAKKSEKRAMDKDNYNQLSLFDNRPMVKMFEVTRLEVRLRTTGQIKRILEKVGIPNDDLTFGTLFSSTISQKVIQHHVAELESRYPKMLAATAKTQEALYHELAINNPRRRLNTILQAMAIYSLLTEVGARGLKDISTKSDRTTLSRYIKVSNQLNFSTEPVDIFQEVNQKLKEFKHERLKDYEL